MKAVGFCLGASSVGMVEIEKNNGEISIIKAETRPHEGNIHLMEELFEVSRLAGIGRVALTGRKFRNMVNLSSLAELESVEIAYSHLRSKYEGFDTIVSAGGETFTVYKLDHNGKIINVFTGNKCASGTGEFFLQQIKRMNLSVEEAIDIADLGNPYSVSGRCSVFCKSDCTHALNKGESKGRVAAGLCRMMSSKILELLKKSKAEKVLFIGGTAQNRVMLNYIRQDLKSVTVAEEAGFFEALGAALWALENDTITISHKSQLFKEHRNSFSFLPAINQFEDKVIFKSIEKGTARAGDRCILGLDVGSTTTKAVLIRANDNAILASIYLRTGGDPVRASRACYRSLMDQVEFPISIVGLGVTGSGRQIAGLHAQTDGIINEIIAHATAAVYFDAEVETIFEIGGQDAKYTFITNRVPSDYAMNEACSAGTGSFLEEASCSIGVDFLDIAELALKSTNPPNFNDQCAAFISSDIKSAIQEGILKEDVVAGLVYSICQNYANRVKGNRPVGSKVFMQGGVCYNRAVPLAMASLTGMEIIVPPEPGLMGAFGVALEVKNNIELGLLQEENFNLEELAAREVVYREPFICGGGKEKCDRKCKINLIEIDQKIYPFGGACNRYFNLRKNVSYNVDELDFVTLREKLVFEKYVKQPGERASKEKRIGIIKSLLTNTLYPLYHNFFTELGLEVVLGSNIDNEGMERQGSSFCYPVELSYCFTSGLIKEDLDYVFLPSVLGMPVVNGTDPSVTCPFVQGEPYYLGAAYKELDKSKIIQPILDFSKGFEEMSDEFISMGKTMGFSISACKRAFDLAVASQKACLAEMREIGLEALKKIESNPEIIGIVLFGRPYNAFTRDANMGIPYKFASRGQIIMPLDFLAADQENPANFMYWSSGQAMLKAARLVERHPQLFGAYITNFSCGPDSFLLGYFRDIMGQKPSLTLELDSHTADAGLDTRIEAFLDIIAGYRKLREHVPEIITGQPFQAASTFFKSDKLMIKDSFGNHHQLTDSNVHLLLPSMGDLLSRFTAASLRHVGVNATCVNPPAEIELKLGRANSSCKECLPCTLVLGSLLSYIQQRKGNELLLYLMAESSGPCRLGQYGVLFENIIKKKRLENVAILTINGENGYAGLGTKFELRAWKALTTADVMSDIYSALLVLARDRDSALKVFNDVVERIESAVEYESWSGLKKVLKESARTLAGIPRKGTLREAKKISMVGETYVRLDSFSRQNLIERFAEKGIVVKVAPLIEWLYYIDYLLQRELSTTRQSLKTKMNSFIRGFVKTSDEKTIKSIMAESGFYELHMINVEKTINKVKHIISPRFTAGDTVMALGTALTEIIDEVSGIILIGPFGCMPNRICETIMVDTMAYEKPGITENKELITRVMSQYPALPFLAIETDGNVFPQVIEARLEAFCLQVERIHQLTKKALV